MYVSGRVNMRQALVERESTAPTNRISHENVFSASASSSSSSSFFIVVAVVVGERHRKKNSILWLMEIMQIFYSFFS